MSKRRAESDELEGEKSKAAQHATGSGPHAHSHEENAVCPSPPAFALCALMTPL